MKVIAHICIKMLENNFYPYRVKLNQTILYAKRNRYIKSKMLLDGASLSRYFTICTTTVSTELYPYFQCGASL